MAGYTKLFSSILDSTIWREKDHVRLVWITMLAMVDQDGIVEASLPGLADRARVSMAHAVDALNVLAAPDEFSRTKTHEGRRIAEVNGGWSVLNFEEYRDRMNLEDRRHKAAIRQQRKRERDSLSRSVTSDNARHALSQKVTLASASESASSNGSGSDAHARRDDPFLASLTTADDELPDDWSPSAALRALSKDLGVDCDAELGKYRAHRKRSGYRCGNWPADFELWLRKAKEFATERGPRAVPAGPPPPAHRTFEDQEAEHRRRLEEARGGVWGAELQASAESLTQSELAAAIARIQRRVIRGAGRSMP